MASWWIFLALSAFLPSGDSKSVQDGASTKNAATPANTNDWKWKAAAEGSNGSSRLLHQEKQDAVKKHAKIPPALPTASPLSMALQEETTSLPTEMMTKVAFEGSPKNALPETKSETKAERLPLETTVMWPWLVDVTSKPPQEPLSTLEQDVETAGPASKGKDSRHSSSLDWQPSTPSLAFLDDPSTAPPHDLIDDSGFSTATQEHTPKDLNSKIKLPLMAATSVTPQHLDEILSTSQTLVDDTEFSAATQKHSLGSGRPGLRPRAKPPLPTTTLEPHKTQKWLYKTGSRSLAFSTRSSRQRLGVTTTSGSSATTQSPLANDTSPLIGKCLLAILLLALVAAVFIVCSGVLAIMLWRQKRAYGLGQANHTEMVCISSLLSAEKEEEEEEEERRRRRQPKVKRVQLLGETSSEMEADNLTLNSFLPEH